MRSISHKMFIFDLECLIFTSLVIHIYCCCTFLVSLVLCWLHFVIFLLCSQSLVIAANAKIVPPYSKQTISVSTSGRNIPEVENVGDCIFFVLTAGLKLTWNRPVSVSSVSSGSFRWVWQISSRPSVHSENSSSSCWSRTSRTRSHFWRTSSASAHPRGLEGRQNVGNVWFW